ncbi:MAG: YdcF family protein [Ruminococcus sp.]|nr:YdcF family protein [Ruminococcus sp.]
MKFKMHLPLILILLFSLLFCCVSVLITAREYHGVYYSYLNISDNPEFEKTIQNGNVEITETKIEGKNIYYTIKPVHSGFDKIEIKAGGEDYGYYIVESYYIGPFNTIFAENGYFDFDGSIIIKIVILIDIIITVIFMLKHFLRCRREARFGYEMVIYGGIFLFLAIYLITLILQALELDIEIFIQRINYPFSFFLHSFATAGVFFLMITMLFMLVFSLAVSLSNLSLIRHEGFRITNLLGVIFGGLWFVGLMVLFFIDENSSGSTLHGTVFDAITNSIAIIISYFVSMLISTVISAAMAARSKPPFDRDYIAILGCAIRDDGSLTPLLRGRVDSAVAFENEQFVKTGKHAKFVPSGGQGDDEIISESEAMKRYLLEQGVPEEQILMENKSVNTYQNLKFSREIIDSDSNGENLPAVATTNYHVFRSYVLAKKVGLKNMRGISAKTKWYFFPNAFLREFVGLVVEEKKKHILILTVLTVITALLSIFTVGI